MNKPLYEQVYEDFKKWIILGLYKPGDKLPSVREVAFERGMNPHTVNRAFLKLEEEGYVETIFKKGSFVKDSNQENKLNAQIRNDIHSYQKQGVPYEDVLKIVKKVYGVKHD